MSTKPKIEKMLRLPTDWASLLICQISQAPPADLVARIDHHDDVFATNIVALES